MSLMGLSSSTSMGTLVLWIQVLVHRCLSRTYEFLEGERLGFSFTAGGLSLSLSLNRIYFDFLHKCFTIKAFRKSLITKMFNPRHSLLTFNVKKSTGSKRNRSRCGVSLPRYERVGLLQRGRVELEQRGDVVPVGHRHQLVLDPLAVGALVATATVHLRRDQRSV